MSSTWIITSFIIVGFLYCAIIILYYRGLTLKRSNQITSLKIAIEEAEILIKKYQIQLQKNIGVVDSYEQDIEIIKNDLRHHKERLAVIRKENIEKRNLIEKLEAQVESLS